MRNKFFAVFLFLTMIFTSAATVSLNSESWTPLIEFCRTNDIQLSFNINLGYANLTRGARSVRLFLTVPYVVSGNNAYLMQTRMRIGEGGEIELPGEYSDRILVLLGLRQETPSAQTNRIVRVEEAFVSMMEGVSNRSTTTTVRATTTTTVRTTTTTVARVNSSPTNNAQNNAVSYNTNDGFIPITAVVIDPGHGGRDPGGMSASGLKEKDIVLAVCKALKEMFAADGRYRVTMTRSTDVFVSLEDRTKTARQANQQRRAVFVSVHANISLDTGSQGVEVYSLSDRPSDDEALDVERLENARFDASDIQATDDLFAVIADLVRDGIRLESEKLAAAIYNSVIQSTAAQKRGLKQAGFYVLKYNTMPSALVEIGFLSSAAEAKKLNTSDYQKKIARGIYNGIIEFIDTYNRTRGFSR